MSDVNTRLGEIVKSGDVVLFMKGTPLFPQCGFSSRAIAILDHLSGVEGALLAGKALHDHLGVLVNQNGHG